MNTITAQEGGYLTQIAYDIPIEERIFVRQLTGVNATYDNFREATAEEIAEWDDYKQSILSN